MSSSPSWPLVYGNRSALHSSPGLTWCALFSAPFCKRRPVLKEHDTGADTDGVWAHGPRGGRGGRKGSRSERECPAPGGCAWRIRDAEGARPEVPPHGHSRGLSGAKCPGLLPGVTAAHMQHLHAQDRQGLPRTHAARGLPDAGVSGVGCGSYASSPKAPSCAPKSGLQSAPQHQQVKGVDAPCPLPGDLRGHVPTSRPRPDPLGCISHLLLCRRPRMVNPHAGPPSSMPAFPAPQPGPQRLLPRASPAFPT